MADVIPLQHLGVCDVDLSKTSTAELMRIALENLERQGEGGYAVRHSRNAVSDFGQSRGAEAGGSAEGGVRRRNPMVAAFPCLFPYGRGGMEMKRKVPVSFSQHVRWALQYYDRRFATHHSFPFVAFGIQQKREALGSVKAHMARRDFERDGALLSSITVADLKQAEAEEAAGRQVSSMAVKVLRRHLRAVGGRVMGSDHSRSVYRPQMWGTTVLKGPAALWMTVNPNDLDDPIAQILAGEDIKMDAFDAKLGPDRETRSRNIAMNPYAAAKFFNFIITALLETLMNIKITRDKVRRGMGILGEVEAYFGVVEAQGRGTLHLHMIIWLRHAPTSNEMNQLLKDSEFREKLKTYVKTHIRAHLDGFTAEGIKAIPKERELAYSRPPNPLSETYDADANERERAMVRSQQVHTCTKRTCLRIDAKTQKHVCKRRAPFPLSEDDVVKANGQVLPRRTYGYLNSWNPTISVCIRCNNDLKFLSSGRDTRHVVWYCTCYATKKQASSHNQSALAGKGLRFHQKKVSYLDDIREQNKMLLFRCLQALNREMEYSAPQVISHMMGWGDSFASHKYSPIYWSSFEAAIVKSFPQLKAPNK